MHFGLNLTQSGQLKVIRFMYFKLSEKNVQSGKQTLTVGLQTRPMLYSNWADNQQANFAQIS